MSFEKLPSGTRGVRLPPRVLFRLMMRVMRRVHRLTGNRFHGMDLLYLTTIGARSGQERTVAVARLDDGAGGWWIVASAAGAASHPAWYHNVVAHPDQVWAEVSGSKRRVSVEQLEGAERDAAWAAAVTKSPEFGSYLSKTDRTLPVLRLTPTNT